jgi:hypothetical protein
MNLISRWFTGIRKVSELLPVCRQTNRNASKPPVLGLNKRISLLVMVCAWNRLGLLFSRQASVI